MGGSHSVRRAFIVTALLLASSLAIASTEAARETTPCPGFQNVPFQGPSCPDEDGLWRVLLDDGSSVLTHGPDAIPSPEFSIAAYSARAMPVCVDDPATQYHNQFIYVVASDRTNRSVGLSPTLRDNVNRSNAWLRDNAANLGGQAHYKFACDTLDTITIAAVQIPTTSTEANFGRITSDLRALGYTSAYAKYWVWYDGSMGNIGGQGTVHNDDRLILGNNNNRGGDFALTYGQLGDYGVLVLVHENGHNLGAVQLSAPHSSGGFHCNDGPDTMCYADGGSRSNYTGNNCPSERFDCGNDDYFHIDPPAGNYLATHWNLGSPLNRFIDFGPAPIRPPVFRFAQCGPDRLEPFTNTTCVFSVNDDEPVTFLVDWDDGTNETVPENGTIAPSEGVTRRHAWTEKGVYDVTITATDTGSPPQSATATVRVTVDCAMRHTGWILVGLQGLEAPGYSTTDRPVPPGCAGTGFELTFQDGAEMSLCWHAADGTRLTCHAEPGHETGVIPLEAAFARLILLSGFNTYYDLHAATLS